MTREMEMLDNLASSLMEEVEESLRKAEEMRKAHEVNWYESFRLLGKAEGLMVAHRKILKAMLSLVVTLN